MVLYVFGTIFVLAFGGVLVLVWPRKRYTKDSTDEAGC